jgi:uncharacterized protein YbbK (DUF523 family)
MDKPRVGISRCLLGDAVRYDGGHKRQRTLIDALGPYVEWVPVCPEVEMGMGTPREPIELVMRADNVRAVGVTSGRDWTEPMTSFAAPRADALKALGISGYVFKARSPSCNVHGTRGLFADAVIRAMPGLPAADEEDLRDAAACTQFLQRVRDYRTRP